MLFNKNIFKCRDYYFFEILAKVAGVELETLAKQYKEAVGECENLKELADLLNHLSPSGQEFSEFAMGIDDDGKIYLNSYSDTDGGVWIYRTYNHRENTLEITKEAKAWDDENECYLSDVFTIAEQTTQENFLSKSEKEAGEKLFCA